MSLRVKQESTYRGENWWSWSVWLEGSDQELAEIELVKYFLHPTFQRRVRTVTDRSTGFRLDSAGWGGFLIRLRAIKTNGEVLRMQHDLQLFVTDPSETKRNSSISRSTRRSRTRVFLSSSVADAHVAKRLAEDLRSKNIRVIGMSDLNFGTPIQNEIGASQLVIGLVSDWKSTWVEQELQLANSLNIPAVEVVVGNVASPSKARHSFKLASSRPKDIKALANSLAKYISEVS